MGAFPFLVSKNPVVGRAAVVMPNFLKGTESGRFISHLTTVTLIRGYTEAGEALYLEGLQHPKLGRCTWCFATAAPRQPIWDGRAKHYYFMLAKNTAPSISRKGL
jgi:hypothetical protein